MLELVVGAGSSSSCSSGGIDGGGHVHRDFIDR